MTTALLFDDLEADEGLRLHAYRDTEGVWTIGYGHTGLEVKPGLTITAEAARDLLAADIARTESGLDRHLPWWRKLDAARQDAIVEMAFNLGVGGLLTFHRFLAAVEAGNWKLAAGDMLLSKWARQVGHRAMRLANLIEFGNRP
jgi:lysozyme